MAYDLEKEKREAINASSQVAEAHAIYFSFSFNFWNITVTNGTFVRTIVIAKIWSFITNGIIGKGHLPSLR